MEKNRRYDDFKSEVLKWKENHAEEYNRFSREIQGCAPATFMQFFRTIAAKVPDIMKEWSKDWNSETPDTDRMTVAIRKSALPAELITTLDTVEDGGQSQNDSGIGWKNILRRLLGMKPVPKVRLSAPLLLAWMHFGRSFETVYEIIELQMKLPQADSIDCEKCGAIASRLVGSSITQGYRTREDWEKYFSKRKAIEDGDLSGWVLGSFGTSDTVQKFEDKDEPMKEEPMKKADGGSSEESGSKAAPGRRRAEPREFDDYILCAEKEKVIDCVARFLKNSVSAKEMALTYHVLMELGLLADAPDATAFAKALHARFSDSVPGLKSASSLRQAIGDLRKDTYVKVDGEMKSIPLIESEEYAPKLRRLKEALAASLQSDSR